MLKKEEEKKTGVYMLQLKVNNYYYKIKNTNILNNGKVNVYLDDES